MPIPVPVAEETQPSVAMPSLDVPGPVQSPAPVAQVKSAPVVPKKGIEVVVTRKGIWQGCRKHEGDVLFIPVMEKVGEWMKCVDPELEKQHIAMMKERKLSAGK
jgi:hypothetical protein